MKKHFQIIITLFLLLPTLALAAALPTVSRVTDIYPTHDGGSYPANMVKVGNITFFTASTPTTGYELWKTDGTAAGTALVKDIYPGNGGDVRNLTAVGTVLYFVAYDGVHGGELWKSDGTAVGTVMVKDIYPGNVYNDPQPYNLTAIGNVLYFAADDGVHGTELWRSDGTAAGTVMVKDIMAGIDSSSPRYLTAVGTVLYFQAYDSIHGEELWKSNGTTAGTVLVKDINTGSSSALGYYAYFTAIGNVLYFYADNGVHGTELWKSDGTAAGTFMVKDIYPGNNADGNPNSSNPNYFTAVGTVLYFRADDGVHGYELWKSNGTTAGTALVKDIQAGSVSSFCYYYSDSSYGCYDPNFTAIGNVLYFSANDGVNGRELWRSNGTAAGTVLVRDINAGSSDSLNYDDSSELTAIGTVLYFNADDGVNGRELWRSDGTAAGTVLVKDIQAGSGNSLGYYYYANLTAVGTVLYFVADDGVHGLELWKSNGTTAGTVLVKDINVGSRSFLYYFTAIGNVLYFFVYEGVVYDENNYDFWKSDGTAAGTVLLQDIGDNRPDDVTAVGNMLYFYAFYGQALRKSDGTVDGTVVVTYIYDLSYLTAVGNMLYFTAKDGNGNGYELWKSDGTAAGTFMVKDIYPGNDAYGDPNSSAPNSLTSIGNVLYFSADDGIVHGKELWKSDGTESGTVLVKDINTGSGGSGPSCSTNIGNVLYFNADDGVHGNELWKSDGTESGTVLLKDINTESNDSYPCYFTAVGNVLYFAANDGVHGSELWRTDGTESGTVLVKDIQAGSGSAWGYYSYFTAVGNLLYFVADDGVHGRELWKSNGTTAGTVLVKDIWAGSGSAWENEYYYDYFTAVNNVLYFNANNGINGNELWQTDGTAAGTQMIELVPGSGGSNPSSLTAIGTRLYFAAADETVGDELWRADIPNNLYTVTPSVGIGGTVSPNTAQIVTQGAITSFTVTANNGYTRNNAVTGSCPQGNWNGNVGIVPMLQRGNASGDAPASRSEDATLERRGLHSHAGAWERSVAGSNVWTTGAIIANCSVSFNFTPIVPTATTLAATNIAATSATLNGSVVSGSATATVSFDFGPTTAYGTNSAATPAQVYSASAVAVSATKTALTCGTTYHFRTKAVNSAGTSYGLDQSFTTSACIVNGVCGNANGSTVTAAPTANLCNSGTASAVTGTGPWTWTCNGANGGTTANCSANIATANQFVVTPSSGANGTISPSTPQTVANGALKSFTVTPSVGYIKDFVVSGTCPQGSWNENNKWTTGPITANCTVIFSFVKQPTAWLSPTNPYTTANSKLTLNLHVDSWGVKINSYDFNVTFDPAKLRADLTFQDESATCQSGVCPGANATTNWSANVDYVTGKIILTGFDTQGIEPGNNLELVKIHFLPAPNPVVTSVNLTLNRLLTTGFGDNIGNGLTSNALVTIQRYKCGDANGDTFINIIDALSIARQVIGLPPPPSITPVADVNGNGEISIVDAMHLARYSVGLLVIGTCLM